MAMEKSGLKSAIIVSAVTFGIGHIVNMFSAEGNMDPKVEMILNIVLIVVFLGGYLLYLVKVLPNKKVSE